MNRIVKIFMVLVLPFALFAQNTITGTVTDAETGNVLPGANVMVGGTAMGAAANAVDILPLRMFLMVIIL